MNFIVYDEMIHMPKVQLCCSHLCHDKYMHCHNYRAYQHYQMHFRLYDFGGASPLIYLLICASCFMSTFYCARIKGEPV